MIVSAHSSTVTKSYELHSALDRRSLFAKLPGKLWTDDSLFRAWVVADPDTAIAILRDSRAGVPDLGALVREIEVRYTVSLPHVAFVCRRLPLLLEGGAHAESRKLLASYLAERLQHLRPRLADIIEHRLVPLRQPGTIDLISQVTSPLIGDIVSTIVGLPITDEIRTLQLLDLFAFNKSLGALKDLDRRVGVAMAFARSGSVSEDILACRLASLVFGMDTLSMLISEGIVAAIREAEPSGRPVDLPEHPVETGVPVTYRIAGESIEVEGQHLKKGDLIQLQLQALGYSAQDEHRKLIFGAGPHSCVGKQLSLQVWSAIRKAFKEMKMKAQISRYETLPSHLLIIHKLVEVKVLP